MLDFFRNHKRLMMFMLILVIVPGLGFVGIQGFRGFFDESANVASVNGHKITRAEYDDAMRQQLDRARQMLGGQFDAKMFDTPERRKEMLDSLIEQRVLADETQRLHLTASDDAVRRTLLSDPVISSLKNPDGSIDVNRYKELLAMQGMTPDQYDERVRYTLATQQLPGSIEGSAFTSKTLAQNLTVLAEQQREVQGLAFNPHDYVAKVQPTDAQLQAYYDAHRNDFATPATATIQYLVMSPGRRSATHGCRSEEVLRRQHRPLSDRCANACEPDPGGGCAERKRGRQDQGEAEGGRAAGASQGAPGRLREGG
jgi:peptidyl-prolyl cis-trans isomerase D